MSRLSQSESGPSQSESGPSPSESGPSPSESGPRPSESGPSQVYLKSLFSKKYGRNICQIDLF